MSLFNTIFELIAKSADLTGIIFGTLGALILEIFIQRITPQINKKFSKNVLDDAVTGTISFLDRFLEFGEILDKYYSSPSVIFLYIGEISSFLLRIARNVIIIIVKIIVFPFQYVWEKVQSPKWYKKEGAIDIGLIEVAVASTAIIIALPFFVDIPVIPGLPIFRENEFEIVRAISVAIPTFASISLLNLYAKEKGSNSAHVLLGFFEDGPFFLLAWSIVIGYILIAFVLFGSSFTSGN